MKEQEYLTIEEVAKKLRVAEATVYRMARKGEIPAVKFGKVWRVDNSKLKNKLNKQSQSPNAN